MNRQILDEEEPPARVPGWAMTYIDLLWLLLLFFILRSVIGVIGEGGRYHEITAALKKRFGQEASASPGESNKENAPIAKDRTKYDEIVREGFNEEATARKRSLTSRGVIYFPEGEEKLQSEHKQILQTIAERIGRTSEVIEIQGEAPAKASKTEKANRSTADPNFARCVAARDYLVQLGVDADRLRIAFGGERHPPGETPRLKIYSVTEITAETTSKKPVKR